MSKILNLPPRVWREIKSYNEWVQKSHNSEEDWIFHALLHAFARGDEVVSKTGDPTIFVQDTKPDNAKKGDLWFNTATEKWFPLTGLSRLFHCDIGTDKIYELCGSTVISTGNSPSEWPVGIGGTFDRLFHTTGGLHELNPDNFAVINSNAAPYIGPSGIGGTSDRLFNSNGNIGYLYEINPTNLTSIFSANVPLGAPSGIGGMSNRLFTCVTVVRRVHELNPNNLAFISSSPLPTQIPSGIGGLFDRLFHCGIHAGPFVPKIYELNPDNLTVISSSSPPGNSPTGIGGLKII